MCRFSRAWTAGGGVDKTPCLRWGRGGREGRGKGKTEAEMLERRAREEGRGEKRLERGQKAGVGCGRVLWVGPALRWEVSRGERRPPLFLTVVSAPPLALPRLLQLDLTMDWSLQPTPASVLS